MPFTFRFGSDDSENPYVPGGGVPAGRVLIFVTLGATGLGDSQGNSYTERARQGDLALWTAPVTTALSAFANPPDRWFIGGGSLGNRHGRLWGWDAFTDLDVTDPLGLVLSESGTKEQGGTENRWLGPYRSGRWGDRRVFRVAGTRQQRHSRPGSRFYDKGTGVVSWAGDPVPVQYEDPNAASELLTTVYGAGANGTYDALAACASNIDVSYSVANPPPGTGQANVLEYDLVLVELRLSGVAQCPGWDPPDDDAKGSVWNLERRLGGYCCAYVESGNIWFRGGDHSRPPFSIGPQRVSVLDGSTDSEPRLAEDLVRRGRLLCPFTRSGGAGVLECTSDDDGRTWSAATTMFSGGKHPTIGVHPLTGIVFRGAYVSGALKGTLQGPGDAAPGAEFSLTGLGTPADDSFHVEPACDTPGRWLLAMVVGTDVRHYVSTDDGQSWTEAT